MGNLGNDTLLLCFLLIIFSQFPFVYSKNGYSNVSCIYIERQALLQFKASLVDNSNRLASWSGEDCCSWHGVTCNHHTGHVERLHLRNPIPLYRGEYIPDTNNYLQQYGRQCDSRYYGACIGGGINPNKDNNCLGGEINPSILHLKHLNYLDLSSNNFSISQIPTFLGSLPNLRYLNLSSAEFSGQIPPHLGNLSNLQYLDLSYNNDLSAMSLQWITGISSLKSVNLSWTNLTESVDWLHSVNKIPSLLSLTLRRCLLVSTNFSTTVSHVNLTSLVSLDLTDNNFIVSPLLLSNLSSLSRLRLADNMLQGPIHSMLEGLTLLTVLDISFNNFNTSSALDFVCNQTSLIYLDLSGNQLEGALPRCLGNLRFNNFSKNIPSELGHLKELSELRLDSNSFKGSIPSSFGQLTKLKYLDISLNLFTGELVESLFVNLKSLKVLDISYNYFLTFNVSSQWIPPFQLQAIKMDSIHRVTQFPTWLQAQRNLQIVSMRNASISGPILLFDANNTTNLSLSFLDLSDNNLTGIIPEYLCHMSSIERIYLANNQLIEGIPFCFGNLKQLYYLDLSTNRLSGHIPSSLGNLEGLSVLILKGNKFSGVLPSSLKNLKSLFSLNLSENQLTGTIPKWIGKELNELWILNLESNKFYGNVSVHLCELLFLGRLYLGNNRLSGHIPNCFEN